MFGIGIIKGTIIGMGIGVMAGLALKEVCKMKRKKIKLVKLKMILLIQKIVNKSLNNGFNKIQMEM